jgi:Bifunctional DNA primase/polymerase, N-terminal
LSVKEAGMIAANTALEIALDYIGRGWNPVPVPFRGKKPLDDEWQKRIINAATAPAHFNGSPMNVGVQLGANSRNLNDVDLDCHEAIAMAAYILPQTGAIFGRASKRNSHRLYYSDLPTKIDKAVYQFHDPSTGEMLLELRIGGCDKARRQFFPARSMRAAKQSNGRPTARSRPLPAMISTGLRATWPRIA